MNKPKIPTRGEQLDAMYVRLSQRDEGAGIRFVDELSPADKGALGRYWAKMGYDDLRALFFHRPNLVRR